MMGYDYQEQRKDIFTESGTKKLLEITQKAEELLKVGGSFEAEAVMMGDSWLCLACLDFLCECNELYEVKQVDKVPGQNRIFIRRR